MPDGPTSRQPTGLVRRASTGEQMRGLRATAPSRSQEQASLLLAMLIAANCCLLALAALDIGSLTPYLLSVFGGWTLVLKLRVPTNTPAPWHRRVRWIVRLFGAVTAIALAVELVALLEEAGFVG